MVYTRAYKTLQKTTLQKSVVQGRSIQSVIWPDTFPTEEAQMFTFECFQDDVVH